MSGVQNDYNQLEGDPVIRVGNWAEERALLEYTGISRGSALVADKNKKNLVNTAQRITEHSEGAVEWKPTTKDFHERVLNARAGPKYIEQTQAPRRALTREERRMEEAKQHYDAYQAHLQEQKEKELKQALYSHRPIMSRDRIIHFKQPGETLSDLNEPAVSFHLHHLGDIQGVTPLGNRNPFNKSTSFSKPIEEYTESTMR